MAPMVVTASSSARETGTYNDMYSRRHFNKAHVDHGCGLIGISAVIELQSVELYILSNDERKSSGSAR
jgi:hypothetical protein